MSALFFSTFPVTNQAFYRAAKSFAIVNLKPIAPGHVLVIPNRVVPRLSDLEDDELGDLMRSVKYVGKAVQKAYKGEALTIACQDGPAAGQTVPHVHFHILPRKSVGDAFADRNDAIYPAIERNEGVIAKSLERKSVHVDASEDIKPRTAEDMEQEAVWLKGFFVDS